MANVAEFEKAAIEIHDDGSKELDAGLRPLDHYKQVHRPQHRALTTATRLQISVTAVCITAGAMGDSLPCRITGAVVLSSPC